MKYEWEKRIPQEILDSIDKVMLGKKFNLIGIAVENPETGEGALILHPEVPRVGDVVMADVFQDILGDAAGYYDEELQKMHAKWEKEHAE